MLVTGGAERLRSTVGAGRSIYLQHAEMDECIVEPAGFLVAASLPLPSNDTCEHWLRDWKDGSPLAPIVSCADAEPMSNFVSKTDWMALPAVLMPDLASVTIVPDLLS